MDILTESGRLLQERDYTLIIDKSEKMSQKRTQTQSDLWSVVKETTVALASECERFDFDGLTLYLYADDFERFLGLSTTQLKEILERTLLSGTAKLSEVLGHGISQYFYRRSVGLSKPQGETFIVITSEVIDREEVQQTIINASQQMLQDEEIGISFIQVGEDADTTKFLKLLDDDLQEMGAKFDLCDTVILQNIEPSLLFEVLLNALID